MLTSLDGGAVRRWAVTCCDELAAHREEIDGLNVFPIADQDTGSNLLATMQAGLDAVLRGDVKDDAPPGGTAAALARGALMGARGNSGVIVSQVLRGLAEGLADGAGQHGVGQDGVGQHGVGQDGSPRPESAAQGASPGGAALRAGLRRADELATAAVSDPMPGTVLTVLHAAAQGAERVQSDDLCEVASAARSAAARALADTPSQLGVLARAGVVDAGGQGLLLLLEALLAVITEHPSIESAAALPPARPAHALQVDREGGSAEYEYEVMYLLDSTEESRITALRAELGRLGDCVAVVGTGERDPLWNVHVHCSDIGAAVEAGVRAGRPHRITVLRFADQLGAAGEQDRFVVGHAVLAMVTGAELAELFRGEGAVIAPAHSSVTELVAILAGTRARHVTVLPGRAAAATVATAAAAQARDTGQDVVVVPTASPVQVLAALAVHDPGRRPADDVVAMAEAAAATRRGELTVAEEEALTWVGRCRPGDVLGLVDDEVVLIEAGDLLAAARGLVDRMLTAGGELVTVLLGRRAPEGIAKPLADYLRSGYPEVEAVVYQSGQPDSVLLVGVE